MPQDARSKPGQITDSRAICDGFQLLRCPMADSYQDQGNAELGRAWLVKLGASK